MPAFDGTGPRGRGPMTGGRRGYCVPSAAADAPMSTPAADESAQQTDAPQPPAPFARRWNAYGPGRAGVWGCGAGWCGGRGRGGGRGRW